MGIVLTFTWIYPFIYLHDNHTESRYCHSWIESLFIKVTSQGLEPGQSSMLSFGASAEHISGPGLVTGVRTGKDSGACGTVAQWVDSRS